MKQPARLPIGSSDPLTFTCTCPASSSTTATPPTGLVLLFYRYFAASPALPSVSPSQSPTALAAFHTQLTQQHDLGGKIRIAPEGFNITVGGTRAAINSYIQSCLTHWSFANLSLDTDAQRIAFFKPTEGGCACVFGGAPASVKVCAEITPMGVTDYAPLDWDAVESLPPDVFHARCLAEGMQLVDVRNHYESRIGYFVDPQTGVPAARPEIRRFAQWPLYVRRVLGGERGGDVRPIVTYCTGGIRCEKGARFLQECVPGRRVYTLSGGIAAYLAWMEVEVAAGRKGVGESLFKGRNYVFDARGSMGLDGRGAAATADKPTPLTLPVPPLPVSKCHICAHPSDRLSKCRSRGCHLVLVVCAECEAQRGQEVRCCGSCGEADLLMEQEGTHEEEGERTGGKQLRKGMCECERLREGRLWAGAVEGQEKGEAERNGNRNENGDARVVKRTQGWRTARRKGMVGNGKGGGGVHEVEIQVRVID